MKRMHWSAVLATLLVAGCSDELTAEDREVQVKDHMETLRPDAAGLQAFLQDMPKGGDLHNHTSGAISMEKLIQWGSEDGACVNTTTFVASNPCAADSVPMSNTNTDRSLYNAVLGAWSMEGFNGTLLEGHQHFFDAFGKYGAVQLDSRNDDSYADIISKAGHNNQIYVELMQSFGNSAGGNIAVPLFSPSDSWDKTTLLAKREQIVATPAFSTALSKQAASIAATLSGARQLMGCDTASPDPGCNVAVRLIASANRTGTREAVFGQWVYSFELARTVKEVVGVNLVSPEENANSLKYYDDEMFALGTLKDFYSQQSDKQIHVSLHAGELIPEVLPTDFQSHITFHIRDAVATAHAERIGHGVDVRGETAGDGAEDLMNDMRDANVMVEICLSSNKALLGASGDKHPLAQYLAHGVPVTFATDDEGILRGNITQEYLAAATDQGLDYPALKHAARVGLQHAFIEGGSLWAKAEDYTHAVDACAKDTLGAATPSADCATYLAENSRAALQWKLENQFSSFEDGIIGKK